jgi:hypothetical protein
MIALMPHLKLSQNAARIFWPAWGYRFAVNSRPTLVGSAAVTLPKGLFPSLA